MSRYDAFLHTEPIGCMASMIFGHALAVFPAVLRLQIKFNPLFYLSPDPLILRITGDLAENSVWRLGGR